MFALMGILALVVLIYVRPQEFIPDIRQTPILYLCFGLALIGLAVDLQRRRAKLFASPQLGWVVLFYLWSVFTVGRSAPHAARLETLNLGVSVILYAIIAHGIQSFRALSWVGSTLLVAVLLIATVGVEQGFAQTGCVRVDESAESDMSSGVPDGRTCETARDCSLGDADPSADYLCERVGWFGTTSISHGRVRYRGVLQDPNELALVLAIGLPLAFIWSERKHKLLRRGALALTLGLVIACTVLTRSRGGQLVLLTVLAAYFIKRYGARGLAAGAMFATPLLLLGGRSGAEASSSTLERLDCWYEALWMGRTHPIAGVGLGQFSELNYLTAHNSYLLTFAELGVPGMLLFSIVFYLSLKIPVVVLQRYPAGSPADVARTWAMALVAAFAGLAVGIFFLSFAYHAVLWIYVGLSGALYAAVKRHDPNFSVRFRWADLSAVVAANLGILVATWVYARWALARS
jgi:O-antigen ligase